MKQLHTLVISQFANDITKSGNIIYIIYTRLWWYWLLISFNSRWHVRSTNHLLVLLHYSLRLRTQEEIEVKDACSHEYTSACFIYLFLLILSVHLQSLCMWVTCSAGVCPFHCCSSETLHEQNQKVFWAQGRMGVTHLDTRSVEEQYNYHETILIQYTLIVQLECAHKFRSGGVDAS